MQVILLDLHLFITPLEFGAEVGGHGSLFGNKMKAMGLLLHKIHLHLYTQTFHKTLEVHGPLRDP